jgi:hypothetical protein
MSDKLLIEIDMNNGELEDAIPALIFLAHELTESGTIDLSSPVSWQERIGSAYQVKWRFAEDGASESRIPLAFELVYRLNDTLKNIRETIPDSENNAMVDRLQNELESCLPTDRIPLFMESYS